MQYVVDYILYNLPRYILYTIHIKHIYSSLGNNSKQHRGRILADFWYYTPPSASPNLADPNPMHRHTADPLSPYSLHLFFPPSSLHSYAQSSMDITRPAPYHRNLPTPTQASPRPIILPSLLPLSHAAATKRSMQLPPQLPPQRPSGSVTPNKWIATANSNP